VINTPGLRIRERTQQHAVDRAEDRAVGAYPQCEGHHRDDREAGALEEPAEGVSKVLAEDFHEKGRTSEMRAARSKAGNFRIQGTLERPTRVQDGNGCPVSGRLVPQPVSFS
jgi:hypothetical protein